MAELNKWRIEQFRQNNKEGKSPDKDFVCLSPKKFGGDPNVVFMSDSGGEDRVDTLESDGLVIVKTATRGRKRKRPRLVYTELSDTSDEEVVANKTRTGRNVKTSDNIFAATKKTAIVMPITKSVLCVDDSELGIVKRDKPPSSPEKTNLDSTDKLVATSETPVVQPAGENKQADSDSDLSLFEVSFAKDSLRNNLSDKFIRNPPPSPIDITSNDEPGLPGSGQRSPSPKPFVINSLDNGFSSDSSDGTVQKKRFGKGKQPANKRRKVVAKSSKPVIDVDEEEPQHEDTNNTEDVIVLKSPDDISQVDSLKDDVVVNSPVLTWKSDEPAHSSKGLEVSEGNEKVTKEVAESSVIVIADDEDDDVVMLTNSDKDRQEQDDFELARRLQAQFDDEQHSVNRVHGPHQRRDPDRGDTSNRRVRFAGSPLPERSERLLQAVGASPALTQFLGSSRTTHTEEASLSELDDVERRLDLLRQLALQNEYIDDAVITEILGVTADSMPAQGPIPPSLRSNRYEGSGTTSRGAGYQHAVNSFHRTLQGLGMAGMEDDSYESLLELADRIGDARQAGLAPEAIALLPCRTYKEGEASQGEAECRICMCEFENGDKLRMLSCIHEYHSRCIDEWLKKKASCPICRENVTFN